MLNDQIRSKEKSKLQLQWFKLNKINKHHNKLNKIAKTVKEIDKQGNSKSKGVI